MDGMPMHHHIPPLSWSTFWTTWDFRPVWTLLAVAALALYVVGLRAARRHGRRGTHPVRVVSFVAGLVALVYTLSSAVDAYAMTRFWVHMVEHLALIMVVPLLVVMGHPLEVTRNALGERGRQRFDAVIRSWPVAIITHPLVSLGLYTMVIVGTHLTTFMDQMAEHAWLMTGEQVVYLVSGYLMWLGLVSREPLRWDMPLLARIILSLIAMSPDTVTGIVLMQATDVVSPGYMAQRAMDAPPALQDQYVGGSIMWFFGDGLMMIAALVLLVDLISHSSQHGNLGAWLDGARRGALEEHLRRSGADDLAAESDGDDDAALAAYNAMLARLNAGEGQSTRR